MILTPLLASATLIWQAGTALPDGFGLSAKYPGDRGIASDARVLFAEDFETGSLEETVRRWSEASNKDGKVLALTTNMPAFQKYRPLPTYSAAVSAFGFSTNLAIGKAPSADPPR